MIMSTPFVPVTSARFLTTYSGLELAKVDRHLLNPQLHLPPMPPPIFLVLEDITWKGTNPPLFTLKFNGELVKLIRDNPTMPSDKCII